jgi:hypothetical protein
MAYQRKPAFLSATRSSRTTTGSTEQQRHRDLCAPAGLAFIIGVVGVRTSWSASSTDATDDQYFNVKSSYTSYPSAEAASSSSIVWLGADSVRAARQPDDHLSGALVVRSRARPFPAWRANSVQRPLQRR